MSERWIDVDALEHLPVDRPLGRMVEGVSLVFLRRDDVVVAIADRCPHQTFPLSEGRLREGKLVCALHGWEFEVFGPPEEIVPPELRCEHFLVRVRRGRVEVVVER